jgi:hypothetical protein
MGKRPITPKEFARQMADVKKRLGGDGEAVHCRMDDLMCDTLRELGYGDGIDIFDDTDKWYS